MSDGTGYDDLSPSKFAAAKAAQQERVSNHWLSYNYNMWTTYHSELNSTWVDPWFESELSVLEVPDNDPDNKMLQNIFGLYCWLSWKGYSKYAMIGMITAFIQESTVTGGAWEHKAHPYNTLINYDATTGTRNNATWYNERGVVWPGYTLSATDYYTGITYTKTATDGTFNAIREYQALQTYSYTDPDTQQTYTRVTLDSDGNPLWLESTARYKGAIGGYGLAQWTGFEKIRNLCNILYPNIGNAHWQLNLTLQLMCLEWQRNNPTDTRSEWRPRGFNVNDQPFFTNPFDTRIRINYDLNDYPTTWEDFASDSFVPWVTQEIATLESDYSSTMTAEQRDYCYRELAIQIWRICYEGATYEIYQHVQNLEEKSLFVKTATEYWDSHGGWDVLDIPRPREIPFMECELDAYHLPQQVTMSLIPNMKRRKQGRVHRTTILF